MSFCVFGVDQLPKDKVEAPFLQVPDLATIITPMRVSDHSKGFALRTRAHLKMQFCDLMCSAGEREMVCRGCSKVISRSM
jgi:hypothetical protein